MTASFSPVAAMLVSSRLRYGLVSVNCSGSVDRSPRSCSSHVAVEQHRQPLGRADPEVMRALRADAEAGGQILVVDDLRARRALHPEPLGHPALVGRGLDRLRGFLNQAILWRIPQLPSAICHRRIDHRPSESRRLRPACAARSTACPCPSSAAVVRDRRPPRRPTTGRTATSRRPAAAWRCSGRRSGCRPRSAPAGTRRRGGGSPGTARSRSRRRLRSTSVGVCR